MTMLSADVSGCQGLGGEHCGHGLRGDLPGVPGGDGHHLANCHRVLLTWTNNGLVMVSHRENIKPKG